MTYPDPDPRTPSPVAVTVTNWAPPVKPPFVKNTTLRTYIIDPANANVNDRRVQISDFEPGRLRVAIIVVDAGVALLTDVPVTTPDTSSATVANQGAYLPVNVNGVPYEFFGPDSLWLNALATVTRVTVIKEYS